LPGVSKFCSWTSKKRSVRRSRRASEISLSNLVNLNENVNVSLINDYFQSKAILKLKTVHAVYLATELETL